MSVGQFYRKAGSAEQQELLQRSTMRDASRSSRERTGAGDTRWKSAFGEHTDSVMSDRLIGAVWQRSSLVTPEILRALHGTVDRWHGISEGSLFDGGFDGCPLCSLMDPVRNGCGACPVRHSTGQDGCHGTPYWDFEHFLITHRGDAKHFDPDGRPVSSRAKALARAEYEFMRGLLPEA
jgi:hypothetical protein